MGGSLATLEYKSHFPSASALTFDLHSDMVFKKMYMCECVSVSISWSIATGSLLFYTTLFSHLSISRATESKSPHLHTHTHTHETERCDITVRSPWNKTYHACHGAVRQRCHGDHQQVSLLCGGIIFERADMLTHSCANKHASLHCFLF